MFVPTIYMKPWLHYSVESVGGCGVNPSKATEQKDDGVRNVILMQSVWAFFLAVEGNTLMPAWHMYISIFSATNF